MRLQSDYQAQYRPLDFFFFLELPWAQTETYSIPVRGGCAVGKDPACPDRDPRYVCWPWAGFPPWSLGAEQEAGRHAGRGTDALLRSCSSRGTVDTLPHPQTSPPPPERDQRRALLVSHNRPDLLQNLTTENRWINLTSRKHKCFFFILVCLTVHVGAHL